MEGKTAVQGNNEAFPAPVGTGASVPSEAEQAFNLEVRQLWDAHREALAAANRSKDEALVILRELGKRLSEAKERLARPGRNGGWSSFVRSLGFSRGEAEGLVRRYRRTFTPQAPCSDGAITAEPTVAEQSQQPMLVPTDQPADGSEARRDSAGEAAVSALTTGPALQPSGEASAITEQCTDGSVATTTEVVQAAAGADSGSAEVV